jgi:hypothetical protein
MPKNSICAEIGVHLGDFSFLILKIVKPKKLYLIDPWVYLNDDKYAHSLYGSKNAGSQHSMDNRFTYVKNRFKKEISNGKVVILRDTSDIALGKIQDASLDWIYIDGNHSYDFITSDIKYSSIKVKKNGFITGDDYEDTKWYKNDVIKAVDEFCERKRIKDKIIRNNQFILRNI